ncbi:hypothetical protein LIER_43706 [Lithospermum erythrorhizon]|uniref:FAE domain-containing protein n=1 Tax=Lithospermum erythrorhizon TaxID=34254 RepID=A0AAV3QN86_LITER
MSRGKEFLSPEIINHGIGDSGPNAGYPNFSVRVRRGLPDFLNSVNLKYVKLGYGYLLNHGLYLAVAPIIVMVFCSRIGRLNWGDLLQCDSLNAIFILGFLCFILYVYLEVTPHSTYLIDFACYTPPDELKISNQEFIDLVRKSGKYGDAAMELQQRVLKKSGLGNETYLPRIVFRPDYKMNLRDGREEARMLMFGAIDDLLATTKIRPKDIKVLIVNCGVLNPTPSLSAMVINHYKLRHNIQSFNLGGMGCSAGIVAIDLAKDMLSAHPGSYALVVSLEAITFTWYSGNDLDMLIPNCFFRMGSAAVLLSNRRVDRWFAKYELKQERGLEHETSARDVSMLATGARCLD